MAIGIGRGNRGKLSEKLLERILLQPRCMSATEVYIKLSDAYEGSKREVPADFMWSRSGVLNLLEVKSLSLLHRLPYHNFTPEQVGRLRRWRDTGAECWVVVHHPHMSGAQWRKIPIEYFYNRDAERKAGSWNLEQFPLIQLQDWDILN